MECLTIVEQLLFTLMPPPCLMWTNHVSTTLLSEGFTTTVRGEGHWGDLLPFRQLSAFLCTFQITLNDHQLTGHLDSQHSIQPQQVRTYLHLHPPTNLHVISSMVLRPRSRERCRKRSSLDGTRSVQDKVGVEVLFQKSLSNYLQNEENEGQSGFFDFTLTFMKPIET